MTEKELDQLVQEITAVTCNEILSEIENDMENVLHEIREDVKGWL